jgi:hypothetical protein
MSRRILVMVAVAFVALLLVLVYGFQQSANKRATDDRLVVAGNAKMLGYEMCKRMTSPPEGRGLTAKQAWGDIQTSETLRYAACPLVTGRAFTASLNNEAWHSSTGYENAIAIVYPFPVLGPDDTNAVYISMTFGVEILQTRTSNVVLP